MADLELQVSNLINFTQAAKLLKISRPTIYNLIERNRLRPVCIGRNRFLIRQEVEGLKEKGNNG